MPLRLVALTEGPDIQVDKEMILVGRHWSCDVKLESLLVSSRHCCILPIGAELQVKDLGSTNGIRINGCRVEAGRLRSGDELAIAYNRYKVEGRSDHDLPSAGLELREDAGDVVPSLAALGSVSRTDDGPLASAVRKLLPTPLAEKCQIQVIVQIQPETGRTHEGLSPQGDDSSQVN
jgi:hypothetical protein